MPPRAVFSNKVTLMQGKYKYVLWPFCIVPPKRAQRFLFNAIVQNHHKNQLQPNKQIVFPHRTRHRNSIPSLVLHTIIFLKFTFTKSIDIVTEKLNLKKKNQTNQKTPLCVHFQINSSSTPCSWSPACLKEVLKHYTEMQDSRNSKINEKKTL